MLIPVVYPSGQHDMVKSYLLNRLIQERKITKFKRVDGWIDIDSNQLRGKMRKLYDGAERRQLEEMLSQQSSLV